jgi:aminopeptidase N
MCTTGSAGVRGWVSFFFSTLALCADARAQVVPEDEQPGWAACACGKIELLQRRLELGLPVDEGGPGYDSREVMTDTDVLSNDVDIEVLPATEEIRGSNTITVRSLINGLTQFTFRLRGNFTVQRGLSGNAADNNFVTLNGTTPAPCTTPPPDNSSYGRTVTLDRPYNAGEVFTVKIDYTGVAVSRGFGSIEFGVQNGFPVVASLSEPYYAATWVPVKDGDVTLPGDNSDRATWTIAVTAPDSLRTTANGLLISEETLPGGRKKYRWRTNYTMPTYLGAFCTTAYNVWAQTYTYPLPGGGTAAMPVEFHIYPASDTPSNRAAWERCLDMLATYRPIYGEYPFVAEKYGIYQFPFGGGMEHQTNSGQGTFSESVTAHELAHQWWGDWVTCKTWNHIWLNEGFATYSEALWEERKPGSSGLPALFAAMAARRPTQVGDSVYVYSTGNLNRIFSTNFTYRKGGWVLHMLRHVLGDAAFFQALADYRATFGNGAATTEDFAAAVGTASGRDLTNFFQQWVYGIGAPAYAFGWQNATINGQQYLRLSVRQTQNTAWPGTGSPSDAFDMPVDVRVTNTQGTGTHVVRNNARLQHYLIPLPAPATDVLLDPEDWVLATAKVAETYTPGPAKIVAASPSPGEVLASAPANLVVSFSEGVNAQASHFALVGPGGSVGLSLSYDTGSFTATLTPPGALAPGAYTLTVSQSMVTLSSGMNLDGEIVGPLPSGDGLPGGSAQIPFTIGAACDADVNCDGSADGFDVEVMEQAVGGDTANFCQADPDFNRDGSVDGFDVEAVEQVVGGAACP